MSKPTKFNRADVIEKATKLYWEKGFHSTSMRNLQEVIDMRPGSIYAAFGSKDNLFKESIRYYGERISAQLNTCLDEAPTILAGLKLFFLKIVLNETSDAPNTMCMIAKTISELTEENSALLTEAKSLLNNGEEGFKRLITSAMANGEVDATKDAGEIARYLQIQLIGLRTYAKAANDQAVVEQYIHDIFVNHPF